MTKVTDEAVIKLGVERSASCNEVAYFARVRALLPEDAIIIPGHGRPMRPVDIEFPLRHLRELDSAVRTAIDKGQSVGATLAAVRMPHYGDYSLFEWVHNSLNVPAAYQHLRELRGGKA